MYAVQRLWLQKTKIPARGLKLKLTGTSTTDVNCVASKNQNPREGIETEPALTQQAVEHILQKTKIPARGLKLTVPVPNHHSDLYFKKPKSPRGD